MSKEKGKGKCKSMEKLIEQLRLINANLEKINATLECFGDFKP